MIELTYVIYTVLCYQYISVHYHDIILYTLYNIIIVILSVLTCYQYYSGSEGYLNASLNDIVMLRILVSYKIQFY